MKRLISILVLVAMMLTSFAATISAVADEIVEGGETETPVVETEKTYNVNWKELAENKTMRAQWLYDQGPYQNNMDAKYDITATENSLTLNSGSKGGDHRQYFSDVMFPLTADTQYVYEFEVNTPGTIGGAIFAYANNPLARDENDDKKDVDGNWISDTIAAYFLMGNLNSGSADLKFGGYWSNYGYEDSKNHKENLVDAKVSEDGYTKWKIVYNGLTVKFYYQNSTEEYTELYAAETITLVEGAKLAFGSYTQSEWTGNFRNCVVTAKNEAAVAAMNATLATDKTAFDAEMAKVAALVETDWFSADWAKFTTAIAAAKANADAAKYQYQVDAATAKAAKAITVLNVTASAIKPAVEALIADVEAIVAVPETQALYTEASWGRMTAALEAAKTTVANAEAKQGELVAAYNVLLATKKGLLTKELAAKNVYNVNWKYLVERTTMKSQWCFDASEGQNNWNSKFTTYATENSIYAKPIGNGDVRQYYSTDLMFDITENTYYEYVFSAKNDPNRPTGYAGVVIGWAIDNNAYIEGGDKGEWKGDIMSAYFLYGAFQNKSDLGDCFDLGLTYGYRSTGKDDDNPNYTINTATGENLGNGTGVAKLDADGYATYKVIYDGYNVTVLYLAEDDTFKPVFGDKVGVFAPGAKVALGIYNRTEGRNIYVKDAVLTSYNEAAAENIVNVTAAKAIAAGEAAIAEDNYTPATVKAVKDAIAAVKAIKADTPAADVDAAIAALQTAILGLKKADKTALIAAIDAANAAIADKTAADFEERYYTPFAAALEAAIAANVDENATQEVVDAALAELVKTHKYLTPAGAACKVDLVDILAVYAKLVETEYKPSSWATLAAPFATANGLNENAELTNADQTAIDEAVVALDTAIKALVKRANFAKLQAIYDRAVALDVDDYTNWTELNMAAIMASAAETLENLELDQADVDAAHKALNDAINALLTWRSNVLAIVPADDYQVNDTVSYPNPDWYNKITDMAYHGLGNVFYYDYHKFVAQQGIVPGTKFDKSLGDTGYSMQGSGDHTIRLGTNVSGSGTNRVTDGVKEGGTDLSHRATPVSINGKVYGHAFGFAFLKAPTVDSIAVYLPTDTKIVSIDVYGAVLTKDAAGNTLYGKADKNAIVTDADGVQCEDATTTKKIYLGTIDVPAAVAGAANILAAGDFAQAMKVDYIYFALTMAEGTGKNAYYGIKEIELFGLADGETVNGKAAPNFAAVNAAYAAFMDCVKADYTDASWAAVEAVLEQYKDVINNLKADQADVDAAAAAIDAAVKALVANPADWSGLDEQITIGSAFKAEDYTPLTFAPFKAAYDAAVALRAATNVPQTAVNKALAALTAVIEALEKRADTTTLKAALEEAKSLKKEEWNKNLIAWNMFENSIKAAEALLANENATQAEVDKVTADLASRRADLKPADAPVAPPTVDPVDPNPGESETNATEKPTEEATKAPETDAPADDKEPAEEGCGGCGSSAAISAIAIVSVIGTAVVIKKKED